MTDHARSFGLLHALAALWLVTVPAGCGGDDDDGTSSADTGAGDDGGDDGGPTPADCPDRCADKAESCSAPADVAASECADICDAGLTADQLDCLEASSCTELEDGLFGSGSLCGMGGSSASAGDDDGDDGGTPAEIGDACQCDASGSDYAQCSGNDVCGGNLTCYVVFGDGICSQSCTSDAEGDDCPEGTCTVQIVQGIEVGSWCVP